MLYLVFVLTFLCGILFYSLSPRDDHLKWDMHRAEGFIAGFLAQHQSAKDYIDMWLGVDYTNKADGITNFNLNKETDGDNFDFLLFAPVGTAIDIDKDAQGGAPNIQSNNGPGYIQTAVFCLNGSDLTGCNGTISDVYLASYSQVDDAGEVRPAWWPPEQSNRQRRYGSWRRSITHRTRGSYSCGVLTCTGWDVDNKCEKWCIDNGQRIYLPNGQCAMTVPKSIVKGLNDSADLSDDKLNDVLFCLTRLKKNPSEYYVAGLNALYDGINNQETGAEGERYSGEGNFWPDLIAIGSAYTQDVSGSEQHVTFAGDTPAVATESSNGGVRFPNIDIRDPFTDFTLTLLLKGHLDDANFNIDVLNLGNLKLRLENDDGSYTVQILDSDGEVANRSLSLNPNEIISLTVIGSSDDLKVYVNGHNEEAFTVAQSAGYVSSAETPLAITHGTGGGLIYGVRYYSGKRLTTTTQKRNGRVVPSELGKNFNVDSKRYGIGTKANPFEDEEAGG